MLKRFIKIVVIYFIKNLHFNSVSSLIPILLPEKILNFSLLLIIFILSLISVLFKFLSILKAWHILPGPLSKLLISLQFLLLFIIEIPFIGFILLTKTAPGPFSSQVIFKQ